MQFDGSGLCLSVAALYSFMHCNGLQLVQNSGAHLYQPMPMPKQLPKISILQTGDPYSGEMILH